MHTSAKQGVCITNNTRFSVSECAHVVLGISYTVVLENVQVMYQQYELREVSLGIYNIW